MATKRERIAKMRRQEPARYEWAKAAGLIPRRKRSPAQVEAERRREIRDRDKRRADRHTTSEAERRPGHLLAYLSRRFETFYGEYMRKLRADYDAAEPARRPFILREMWALRSFRTDMEVRYRKIADAQTRQDTFPAGSDEYEQAALETIRLQLLAIDALRVVHPRHSRWRKEFSPASAELAQSFEPAFPRGSGKINTAEWGVITDKDERKARTHDAFTDTTGGSG